MVKDCDTFSQQQQQRRAMITMMNFIIIHEIERNVILHISLIASTTFTEVAEFSTLRKFVKKLSLVNLEQCCDGNYARHFVLPIFLRAAVGWSRRSKLA